MNYYEFLVDANDILSFFTSFSPKSFLFMYLCKVNFGVTFPMLRKEW